VVFLCAGDSDPYVDLSILGVKQPKKSRTCVIENTNDPCWNEDFTLLVPDCVRNVLHCQVWDKDKWTTNDKMGWADIPIVEVAASMNGIMQRQFTLNNTKRGGTLELRLEYFEPMIGEMPADVTPVPIPAAVLEAPIAKPTPTPTPEPEPAPDFVGHLNDTDEEEEKQPQPMRVQVTEVTEPSPSIEMALAKIARRQSMSKISTSNSSSGSSSGTSGSSSSGSSSLSETEASVTAREEQSAPYPVSRSRSRSSVKYMMPPTGKKARSASPSGKSSTPSLARDMRMYQAIEANISMLTYWNYKRGKLTVIVKKGTNLDKMEKNS